MLATACRKTYITFKNGCLALLALLVLHRAKLLASNQSVLALGVVPHSALAWMLTSGRTKSVQDAPATNDHGCTEAKLSECPKEDMD